MTNGPGDINAVVIGATGYVGGELLRLLSQHPDFSLLAALSGSQAGTPIGAVFPHLAGACAGMTFAEEGAWAETLDTGANVALFSAAPHGASAPAVADALAAADKRGLSVHVVDCSADFRYADAEEYRRVYGGAHAAPRLLDDFFCAVPEHATVAGTPHVGHPGCFATAVLLAAVPLAKTGLAAGPMFVSAITGSTGSGRTAQPGTHHPERHGNLYAYKPLSHRHVPEIERLVERAAGKRVAVNFVPHSGPFSRGIYATLQASLAPATSAGAVREAFASYYAGAHFVRIVDDAPRLKDVVASNYCHIGIEAAGDSVVVTCAIDNLIKGAAGGAVQWMNRLWSLPETSGLLTPAAAWT